MLLEVESLKTFGLAVFFVIASWGTGYFCNQFPISFAKTSFAVVQSEINDSSLHNFYNSMEEMYDSSDEQTGQEKRRAEWIRQKFRDFGLDEAIVIPYQVLLFSLDKNQPNNVQLLDESGRSVFIMSNNKTILTTRDLTKQILPSFVSRNGIAEGGLVYAHLGREQDYSFLYSKGINVSDNIILVRYSEMFPGDIISLASEKRVRGVLMYSDPMDYQSSDIITRHYIKSWLWFNNDNNKITIPCLLISHEDAEILLRALKAGERVPHYWLGNLDAPYYLGPEFIIEGWKIKMQVHFSHELTTSYNIIGVLRGIEEPDRYVLIGSNQEDGLSKGTGSMLEMARVFGKLKQAKTWKPRRSLVFCSWAPQSLGLIGSYKWMQEHLTMLNQRAIVYLNIDTSVEAYNSWKGSPAIHAVLKDIRDNIWSFNVEDGLNTNFPNIPHEPRRYCGPMSAMDEIGDPTTFFRSLGIPTVQIGTHEKQLIRILSEVARNLTESIRLPIDINSYAIHFNEELTHMKKRFSGVKLGPLLELFEAAIGNFSEATEHHVKVLNQADFKNMWAARRTIDQLIQLERYFVINEEPPNNPLFNENCASGSLFDRLKSLIDGALRIEPTESEMSVEWRQINNQLSLITNCITTATKSLLYYM